MATRYTFNNGENYFNSVLSSTTSSTSYTIESFGVSKSKPDYTSITSSEGKSGVIHWRQKDRPEVFQIDGVHYDIPSVGVAQVVFDMQTVKRWTIGGRQWQSGYHKPTKTWTVFRVYSGAVENTPVVTFHQHKSTALAKSEAATIIVEPSVSQEEFLTILLVLLWSKRGRIKSGSIRPSDALAWGIVGAVAAAAFS